MVPELLGDLGVHDVRNTFVMRMGRERRVGEKRKLYVVILWSALGALYMAYIGYSDVSRAWAAETLASKSDGASKGLLSRQDFHCPGKHWVLDTVTLRDRASSVVLYNTTEACGRRVFLRRAVKSVQSGCCPGCEPVAFRRPESQ